MLNKSLLCLALVFSAGLIGCASDHADDLRSTDGDLIQPAPTPLVASDNPAVADVPMPKGFVLVPSVSRTIIGEGSRTIHHLYEGIAPMPELVTYLRVNVGKYNWERVVDKEGVKASTLEFTKGRERLVVRLELTHKGYTTITLDLESKLMGTSPAK